LNNLNHFVTTYLYDIVLFAVALIGIFRFKKQTLPFRILAISAICSLGLVILEDVFIIKFQNNAPIYHIEAISGYTFYALIYYCLFTNKLTKKLIIVSLIVVIPFAVYNAIYLQSFIKIFPTYVNLPTLGLLVIMSLLLFNQMLTAPSSVPLLKQSIFWFNTAILFYSTTKFLNIGLSNTYTRDPSLDDIVFYLWYFTDYIFAILQGIALFTSVKSYKTHAL